MARQIEELIENGYTYFISGGALGVDQDFAEAVLRAKQVHAGIVLEIAVPCSSQSDPWREADRRRYQSILDRADKVTVLSEHYTRFCMQKRNEYMIDKSDLVLAFWNGDRSGGTWNAIQYAERKGKKIQINTL